MSREYLVNGPVRPELICSFFSPPGTNSNTGGHSTFMGQVREDIIDGRKVKAIEYSAYEDMVASETEKIKTLTYAAFPDVQNIEIIHSTGKVLVGEMSLFILVSAGHRDQAIRGCRHVLEMIKKDYPVWKKEIFEDDSHHWRENQ